MCEKYHWKSHCLDDIERVIRRLIRISQIPTTSSGRESVGYIFTEQRDGEGKRELSFQITLTRWQTITLEEYSECKIELR